MSKLFCYKNKLWKVINHFTGGINESHYNREDIC
jgi:hypothetical protein